jgi:beta-phosphoglucomutase-like phosphatase (HAD superfamily)
MTHRAAAVDLDGILLDGMPFHIAAWREAFAGHAVTLDTRDLYLLEGIKSREVVDHICDQYALPLSLAEREHVTARKRSVYKEIFEAVPLEGAGDLMEALLFCVGRVSVVTGTIAAAAVATLAKLGVEGRVEHIISADLEIPGKPDPAPFREASRRMGASPALCLAVDNAPPGIASAVAAGLRCVGVATYLPAADLAQAEATFASVGTLAAWLREEYKESSGCGEWMLPTRIDGGYPT